MQQKDYWNSVADKKEFTTPFQLDIFSEYVPKDAKILDVGCGYGRTLSELHNHGYANLTGIDFSEKMIERGKFQFPYLDLHTTSGSINYGDNSFDAIIIFAVLTCIISDEEQTSLLEEAYRVLKPNGIIYINDFLLNTDERNIARYNEYSNKYGKYGVFKLPEGAIVRHHDMAWVKTSTQHFEPLELEQVVYTTMNGNKSNGYFYFGRKK